MTAIIAECPLAAPDVLAEAIQTTDDMYRSALQEMIRKNGGDMNNCAAKDFDDAILLIINEVQNLTIKEVVCSVCTKRLECETVC